MGFGVWGLGFGVWGLGFGVWGLGFGVWGLGFGVWGLGFGVGVWDLGFGVQRSVVFSRGLYEGCKTSWGDALIQVSRSYGFRGQGVSGSGFRIRVRLWHWRAHGPEWVCRVVYVHREVLDLSCVLQWRISLEGELRAVLSRRIGMKQGDKVADYLSSCVALFFPGGGGGDGTLC